MIDLCMARLYTSNSKTLQDLGVHAVQVTLTGQTTLALLFTTPSGPESGCDRLDVS